MGFAEVLTEMRGQALGPQDHVVDLGSGGGLPGLVLAARFPGVRFSFIEGSTRRAAFLEEAVVRCQLEGQVEVVAVRAEMAGRDPALRSRCTAVVSRAFGSPGETAECGSPFLGPGGLLVVSEPPEPRGEAGWPPDGLALLGLAPIAEKPVVEGFVVFRQAETCPDRYPRRTGIPRKRPLF